MTKIEFSQGTQKELLNAPNLYKKEIQGSLRNCLEFSFDLNNNFSDLYELLSNESNTKCFKLIEDDKTYIYENYQIFSSLSFDGQKYSAVLGELTYTEKTLQNLTETVDNLVIEILEV